MRIAALAPFLAAPLLLAGCSPTLEAPRDTGVCWHLVAGDNGKPKFNRLADHQPDLEHCAAQLEIMRQQFQSLGVPQENVTGAYQGQFLFIQREGVFTSQSYDGFRYVLMVPTGDGRLAVPGAMPNAQ